MRRKNMVVKYPNVKFGETVENIVNDNTQMFRPMESEKEFKIASIKAILKQHNIPFDAMIEAYFRVDSTAVCIILDNGIGFSGISFKKKNDNYSLIIGFMSAFIRACLSCQECMKYKDVTIENYRSAYFKVV